MNFKPDYLREMIRLGQQVDMYASCHDTHWPASESELQQLRVLLDAMGIDERLGWPAEPEDDNADAPFASLGSNRPGHEEKQ